VRKVRDGLQAPENTSLTPGLTTFQTADIAAETDLCLRDFYRNAA
jgi:hypothetical protein